MVVPVLKAFCLVCLLYLTLVACGTEPHTDLQGGTAGEGGAGAPATVVAAGDISSCQGGGDAATAELLGTRPGMILVLGDEAYEDGSPEQFGVCYGPTWGRFKARTRPVAGNHEYHTEAAAGYFGYFGASAGNRGEGYYSFDLGDWHLIALNSNCGDVGGCDASSPQGRWLKADLADDHKKCTLAYFHHPLFSSGRYRPGIPEVRPLWEALYAAGADLVLNGHDHNYQRFAPQDPGGKADAERGIREFVVGTGGKSHYAIGSPIANAQRYDDHTFGVLRLTLLPGGYRWRFVPVAGQSFTDSGHALCH